MKSLKKTFVGLAIAGVIGFSNMAAFAEGFGVVDLEKIYDNYQKVQDLSADLKIKDAELQKFIADAQKQLKDAKSPVDRKNLEDKLSEEYKTKAIAAEEYKNLQLKTLNDNVNNVVNQVIKEKKYDMVFNKSAVIYGGNDVTDSILTILNTTTAVPAPVKKK